MESKTKHRILGLLVVAGLIVIALPLFQTNRELPPEATAMNKPPFPDQSEQVASPPAIPMTVQTSDELKQQPDETIKKEQPTVNVAPAAPVINTPATIPAPVVPPKVSEAAPVPLAKETITSNTMTDKVIAPEPDSDPVVVAKPKKISLVKKKTRIKMAPIHSPLDDNGLFKLQSASYVIQIGSFKNKANALRVVNNLRASGYRAFIQRISSLDESTRVFVGPETQQTSAREVAQQIEKNMHLHGIVISYKPLAI